MDLVGVVHVFVVIFGINQINARNMNGKYYYYASTYHAYDKSECLKIDGIMLNMLMKMNMIEVAQFLMSLHIKFLEKKICYIRMMMVCGFFLKCYIDKVCRVYFIKKIQD